MKELITEEQCHLIVLLLSIAVTLISLGIGFYLHSKTPKYQKKSLWAQTVIYALFGPVIWIFWKIYNAIEDYYGLDSLRGLKYNFYIAVGIAIVFVALI